MVNELEPRTRLMIGRLGFVPEESDADFLEQVPYWKTLIEHGNTTHPLGFFGFVQDTFPQDYFQESQITIPSLEQKIAGAQIAHRRKVIDLSKPGTRKTISSLSAIVPIGEQEERHVPTFITCPGYVIPTWIKEIEKLFRDPTITVITRENRERAILKAAAGAQGFIIVGYDMTFRPANISNGGDISDDFSQAYMDLFLSGVTSTQVAARLRPLLGQHKASHLAASMPLPKLLSRLVEEEYVARQMAEAGDIVQELRSRVFRHGIPYYCLVDEFHNIVNDNTKRGVAIASIAKDAPYVTLISGTGIGSSPESLAWAAYVLGFVKRPHDFRNFIRGKHAASKVKAFVDMYALHPIRKLKDIDSLVKDPIEVEKPYGISPNETRLLAALVDSDLFEGREKYLLFRYLITNPHKLLPEKFAHLGNGDGPIVERLEQFYEANPGLEDAVRSAPLSRMEHVRNLVSQIKAMGKKCLIACEYQTDVTTELERILQNFGVRRIDQTVSSELREVRLTAREKTYLDFLKKNDPTIASGDEVYRSDLTPAARRAFKLKSNEVYGMSDRDKVMHEFATNPDITALVSTRLLREGVELREATYIIDFEDTTIPWKYEQFNGRTLRSGQREQVYIWRIRSPLLELLEEYIRGVRLFRQGQVNVIYDEHVNEKQAINSWLVGDSEDLLVTAFSNLSPRILLGQHFNSLEGAGPLGYSNALRHNNNAMFVADLYAINWESTTSGNMSRLATDLTLALEKYKGVKLERILDAACGPMALARNLGRQNVIGVDMNRYMLEHGKDAVDELSLKTQMFMGDITDLSSLLPFEQTDIAVFESGATYGNTVGLPDESLDGVVASMVFDLLDGKGRAEFLNHAHRVLDKEKYLIVIIPSKKIDPSCKRQFEQDVEATGFSVIEYLTGTYQGYRESRQQPVDAYVLVAQKKDNRSDTQPELTLRPEVRIVDSDSYLSLRHLRRMDKLRPITADQFVKIENGLDLRDVKPETLTVDDVVAKIRRTYSDTEIADALNRIGSIFGEGSV